MNEYIKKCKWMVPLCIVALIKLVIILLCSTIIVLLTIRMIRSIGVARKYIQQVYGIDVSFKNVGYNSFRDQVIVTYRFGDEDWQIFYVHVPSDYDMELPSLNPRTGMRMSYDNYIQVQKAHEIESYMNSMFKDIPGYQKTVCEIEGYYRYRIPYSYENMALGELITNSDTDIRIYFDFPKQKQEQKEEVLVRLERIGAVPDDLIICFDREGKNYSCFFSREKGMLKEH